MNKKSFLENKILKNKLSEKVNVLYSDLETEILVTIAKQLKEKDDMLYSISVLTNDNQKIINDFSKRIEKEIERAISETGELAENDFKSFLESQVKKGNLNYVADRSSLKRVIGNVIRKATNEFNILNANLLNGVNQVYNEILLQATIETTAGLKSRNDALIDAMRKYAKKGVPVIVDSAGRKWHAETYAEMVMRTNIQQTARNVQDEQFELYGVEYVEISQHEGARPLCSPHQGKVFYRGRGESELYPPLSSTSMGAPAGLFGINCGHVSYPFIPGVNEKPTIVTDVKENDRIYEESQQQRYLERQIRKAKRELRVVSEFESEQATKKSQILLEKKEEEMEQFIKKTGRTRRKQREKIILT